MARFDVYDMRNDKSYIIEADNADIARGMAAERWNIPARHLSARLQIEEEQTERAIEIADSTHKAVTIYYNAARRAEKAGDRGAARMFASFHKVVQEIAFILATRSKSIDAEKHIKAIKAFEEEIQHPDFFLRYQEEVPE